MYTHTNTHKHTHHPLPAADDLMVIPVSSGSIGGSGMRFSPCATVRAAFPCLFLLTLECKGDNCWRWSTSDTRSHPTKEGEEGGEGEGEGEGGGEREGEGEGEGGGEGEGEGKGVSGQGK